MIYVQSWNGRRSCETDRTFLEDDERKFDPNEQDKAITNNSQIGKKSRDKKKDKFGLDIGFAHGIYKSRSVSWKQHFSSR